MGTAWVDDLENPTCAQVLVVIFVFYAGNPKSKEAEELLHNIPYNVLAIVDTQEWKERIETVHKNHIEKFQRYKFKKNVNDLDRNHLESYLTTLPDGYELKRIDKSLAENPNFNQISEDFTSQFDSIDDYIERGIGFGILHNGEVVCGASSYSIYNEGIGIEVATHRKHRRKGLATVASSALILECLKKGIYPSWDAANYASTLLAEELGYILDKPYDTYYIYTNQAR